MMRSLRCLRHRRIGADGMHPRMTGRKNVLTIAGGVRRGRTRSIESSTGTTFHRILIGSATDRRSGFGRQRSLLGHSREGWLAAVSRKINPS